MKFPYSFYDALREFVEGRHKDYGYRRLSGFFYGTGSFAIRPNAADPAVLEIIDSLEARKHRLRPDKRPAPPALLTLFPDRFTFWQRPNATGGTCLYMSKLIHLLTHKHYHLEKYRKLATNATYMLVPSRVYEHVVNKDGTFSNRYSIPALGITTPNYRNKVPEVEETANKLVSRNGFTYYRDTGPVSHEPILKRHWVPEKRREYLRQLKDLHKHGEIRARLGAFDKTVQALVYKHAHNPYRSSSEVFIRRAALEKVVQNGDLEDHETYKCILEYGATFVDSWDWPNTPDGIMQVFDIGLNKMKEPLRKGLGAVVYS